MTIIKVLHVPRYIASCQKTKCIFMSIYVNSLAMHVCKIFEVVLSHSKIRTVVRGLSGSVVFLVKLFSVIIF